MLELFILWIYQHEIPGRHQHIICLIEIALFGGGVEASCRGYIEDFELADSSVYSLIRQGPIRTDELLLVLDAVEIAVVSFVVMNVMCFVVLREVSTIWMICLIWFFSNLCKFHSFQVATLLLDLNWLFAFLKIR